MRICQKAGVAQRIERLPRLGGEARQDEFDGQFASGQESIEAGIDTRGIGAQDVAQAGISRCPLVLRGTVQPYSTLEAVYIQRVFAKDFGQSAGGQPAGQLHLPQAVLGVTEALAEVGVEWVAGADVGNAPPIADDLHRGGQALEADLAVQLGQWPP